MSYTERLSDALETTGYRESRISSLVPHFCQLRHVKMTLCYTIVGYLMSTLLSFVVIIYIKIKHDS